MNFGVTGIVINGFDQILLIKRNDTETWAAPAGSLEAGELLTEAVKREVQEETGVKVMPVRLVGMNYSHIPRIRSHIQFIYRCMEAGGELKTTEEAIEVGYAKTQRLPRPMLAISRKQIEQSTNHTGPVQLTNLGIPWSILPRWIWLKLVVYPRYDRQRKSRGEPPYQPPPQFDLSAVVVVRDAKGDIVWVENDGRMQLPSASSPNSEAPWDAAARIAQSALIRPVTITRPVAVLHHKTNPEMTIVWEGKTDGRDGLAQPPAGIDEQMARFVQLATDGNEFVRCAWL